MVDATPELIEEIVRNVRAALEAKQGSKVEHRFFRETRNLPPGEIVSKTIQIQIQVQQP